jgi:hypothetical protein
VYFLELSALLRLLQALALLDCILSFPPFFVLGEGKGWKGLHSGESVRELDLVFVL